MEKRTKKKETDKREGEEDIDERTGRKRKEMT
jgi:hypothetical protein